MLPVIRSSRTRDFPSIFNSFFNHGLLDIFDDYIPVVSAKAPLVNTSETDTEYKLEVLAPKLEAADLKIEVEDRVLHISTEKEWKPETDISLRQEYRFSYTSRSFDLPENADEDAITAKNENGVIVIIIPKKEVEKPTRKAIEIQ